MSAPAQSLAALSQTATTGIPDILSGTEDSQAAPAEVGQAEKVEKGFFELLVQSIWEPGANYAVVMAMNISFFFLILVLFALAFLTSWNPHVLLLLGVTTLLWGAMMWFVMELTKMQLRPDNMPPGDPNALAEADGTVEGDEQEESKKDQ